MCKVRIFLKHEVNSGQPPIMTTECATRLAIWHIYMMHVMWPIDTIYYRVRFVRYNKPLQTLPIIPTPTLAAWIMLTSLPPSPVNTTTNMQHVIFKRKPFCSSLFTTFQDAVTLGKWTWEQNVAVDFQLFQFHEVILPSHSCICVFTLLFVCNIWHYTCIS